jgi:putative membrane protein
MIGRPHPLSTEPARARLRKAVANVEGLSAAEIVIAVRPISDRYTDIDLAVGAVVAWIALVFTLFAEMEFDLDTIAILVPGLGVAAGVATRLIAPLRRALARSTRVEAAVDRAARACFVEKRVTYTRGRTGVLLYLSLFEQRIAIVADAGIDRALAAVHRGAWDAAASKLVALARTTGLRDPEALARAIEELAGPLERALPRSTDDLDELPDFADPR